MAENRQATSAPETEKKEDISATDNDYQYMVNWDYDPPTLIRLGSFAKMEADLFAYPGVWKDTPHLNDIRVGLGSFMDYDDISKEEAMKIMKKIQEHYDRKAAEERS